jgi:tetratricopeptide (TPR) repeat protein
MNDQNQVRSGHQFLHEALIHRSVLSVSLYLALLNFAEPAVAENLPPSLTGAIEQVEAGEGQRAFSTLRRFAFSDEIEQRLNARIALAQFDREAGRLERGASWVNEYQSIQKENIQWPRVDAFVEAQKIQFLQGNAFAAVKNLSDANGRSQGLAKISVERALSWVVEQQPDIEQALEFEKSALQTGKRHFKREKVSESEGLEDVKPGFDVWSELQPQIEERIAALQRTIEIDSYGLDFVLYKEAQGFRNASHPLALDFTNVAAAFGKDGEIGGRVPKADYEMAMYRYNELIQLYSDNPYGQAAKLYRAVCIAKTGEVDEAINLLEEFYEDDVNGLFRGEALSIIGDLYSYAKWDFTNAEEAYRKSLEWIDIHQQQNRILESYLIPEKSRKISQPPSTIRYLDNNGMIAQTNVSPETIINRVTAKWYLEDLEISSMWKIGFISIIEDDWAQAMETFDKILKKDKILKGANSSGYHNAYNRLSVGAKKQSVIATKYELAGLNKNIRNVVILADFLFVLESHDKASGIYQSLIKYGKFSDDQNIILRGYLGWYLIQREKNELTDKNVPDIDELVRKYPESAAAPFLLEICANYSRGNKELQKMYFNWIYTEYPNSFFAKRARYFEILHVLEPGAHKKRHEMILKFKEDFPSDEGYHSALDKYNKWFLEN